MSSLAFFFGNGTDVVHWQPNPTTRGTFDILSTCIITLLLCVWTAIHLNVPPPGGYWGPKLRKVRWMILALLAPEIVALVAWDQRKRAQQIVQMVNRAYSVPEPPSSYRALFDSLRDVLKPIGKITKLRKQKVVRQPTLESQNIDASSDRHPWTLVHGFYLLMGGYAINIPKNPPESKSFVPARHRGTWFLRKSGLNLLLAMGKDQVPNLAVDDINSRSKADGLAKTLVCAQALWFIVTCLTRFSQNLPISLLELNTLGHAACAVVIYLVWWQKPFEVDCPLILQDEILMDLFAMVWMNSAHSSFSSSMIVENSYRKATEPKRDTDYLLCESSLFTSKTHRSPNDFPRYERGNLSLDDMELRPPFQDQVCMHSAEEDSSLRTLKPGEHVQGTGFHLRDELEDIWSRIARNGNDPVPFPRLQYTKEDSNRWQMADRACKAFVEDDSDQTRLNDTPAFNRRCKDFPRIWPGEAAVALGLGVAACLYGGIHALAWSAYFGSATEQLLWRISACVVMGGLPVMFAIATVMDRYESWANTGHHDMIFDAYLIATLGPSTTRFRKGRENTGLKIIVPALIMFGAVLLAYVLARAYLIVECFMQLSHLPADAYKVPQWSAYFPHIS